MTKFRIPVGILLCCLICCSNASAQYTQPQPNPPRKKSAMEKLSQLNKKLKNSLKQSLFGDDEAADSQQNYQTPHNGYNQPPQYSQGRNERRGQPNDYRSVQYDSRYPQQGEQHRASQAQYQQEIQHDWQTGQANPNTYRRPANEQFDTPNSYAAAKNMPPPNPMRTDQGQNYGSNSDMGYAPEPRQQSFNAPPAPRQMAAPQAQPAHSNQVNQNGQYRTGHYQNGGMTQQLLDQQETATQRVLRLNSEKQSLMEAQRSATAENKRLKSQLREKTALLKEIEAAINAARSELRNANNNNKKLNAQIVNLEAEKAQQSRASTRQLNAIRKKLDDVLMLEMTSK